ncbi:MAG: hypothetical protein WC119_09790 [Synergistaceae bacterium]|jgi:hypothetical protein
MITDYESIFAIKQPWPPEDADTRARLNLYERNANLFKGQHNAVWLDHIRKLRGDGSGDLRIVFNFHKLLSRLWSDLVCGEIPEVTTDQEGQIDALKRIIAQNMLWLRVQDGVIDYSKHGTNVLKIRYDKRGIIENIPPKYWFPVVEVADIKAIKAHIIAYTFPSPFPEEAKKDITYLKVEIHIIGKIEHRLYRLKEGQIELGPLPLDTFEDFKDLQETEDTGLDDFDIIDIQNKPETDQLIGSDDYSDINSIIHELEMRYAQIFRIEDKFADPSMYGPPIEEQDPRDGSYRVMGGSRYITVLEGQTPPGIIDPRGPPVTSYTTIADIMQRLYEMSETCKVAFDASQAGAALSGTALRLMMTRPLAKASGIKLRYDASLQKAIRLCSKLEVQHGLPGALEITDFHISWKDGLPDDPNEEAQRDSTLVSSQARSAQGLMREKGYSDEQILQEKSEMSDQII